MRQNYRLRQGLNVEKKFQLRHDYSSLTYLHIGSGSAGMIRFARTETTVHVESPPNAIINATFAGVVDALKQHVYYRIG
jgi:hypothetical protein